MTTIIVRLEISVESLIFTRWLPLGENLFLTTENDNVAVRLWFDSACIKGMTPPDLENIENYLNPTMNRVKVDIIIKNISEEFTNFIYEYSDWPESDKGLDRIPLDVYQKELTHEYNTLGETVLKATVDSYNRMISFFRIYKGQYWLQLRNLDINMMPSDFTEFRAKVKSEDKPWIRWCPPSPPILTIINFDEARCFQKQEWEQFANFMGTSGKPDLVLELLANADALSSDGLGRSSIIEAVAALELAVITFSRFPDEHREGLRCNELQERLDGSVLKSQVEHLGFSGAVRYLLPMIFTEDALPTGLLKQCQRAIEVRQNVVHNGQRNVDEKELGSLLKALRTTADIVHSFTLANEV